jgi:hypothetical protein
MDPTWKPNARILQASGFREAMKMAVSLHGSQHAGSQEAGEREESENEASSTRWLRCNVHVSQIAHCLISA